jgi:beta-lactamase class A/glucose/arabinose dehydrogenase
MYIVEAGYAYGPKEVGPGRVIRIDGDAKTVVQGDLSSPATDVKFNGGDMYVAHRGHLSVVRDGIRQDVISGLPSGDHFTGEIAFDQEGWIYLGNGTVTNSGVVGDDSFQYGWASENPGWHDVPARDVTLAGANYTSSDLRTLNPLDAATTGAFVPFGSPTSPGQVVPASVKASGVVLRVRPDGSGLEIFAWGLRNPFALRFSPDGTLYAIDQGYDDRGSRPVANAPDPVYAVEEGGWYGWPDYVAGIPITDPSFASARSKRGQLSFLMEDHPPVVQPLAKLEPHTAAAKFDFAPRDFDALGRMFIAAFGAAEPVTGSVPRPTGSRVLALDPRTGSLEAFAYNRDLAPAGKSFSGFNHPIDVKFGPDGCMYVVDFGVFEAKGQTFNAVPGTGAIWKISQQRSEYKRFSADSAKSLSSILGGDAWSPDYTALSQQLADYTGSLGQEWGLFFKDLTTGRKFGLNQGIQVPAASTVKVPVILYASELASQGKLNWNERLEYRAKRDWQGGAGSMQYTAKDGDTYSIRELAEKAIRESDNVAWKMLEKRLGKENIARFMRQLGGKVVYPWGLNVSTPEDLALYMEAALEFSKRSDEGDKLMYDLAHTIWNTGMNRYITEVPVAHKEGDLSGVANDVGLVYAEHPYILAIMSRGHGDVELGFEHIGVISRMVYDYQARGGAVQAWASGERQAP